MRSAGGGSDPTSPAGARPLYRLRSVRQRKAGREVLRGIDLEIARGEITVVVGPSGAGKTSLLRLLNRLDDPAGGEIRFEGRPLGELPVRALRRRVGFVFQEPAVFGGTVLDNLLAAAEIAGMDPEDGEATALEALEMAELDPSLLHRPDDELSVGQKQRVTLARALVSAPDALLLDEPTAALDPETSDRLMRTVEHLCSDGGRTVVLATHRMGEAARFGGPAIRLRDGRVEGTGPAAELGREA